MDIVSSSTGPTYLSIEIMAGSEVTLRNKNGFYNTFPAGTFSAIILHTPIKMTGTTDWDGKKIQYECEIRPKWNDTFSTSQFENKLTAEFKNHLQTLADQVAPQTCSKNSMDRPLIEKYTTSFQGKDYEVCISFSLVRAMP